MKKLLVIACMLTGCGLFQPIPSALEYLHSQFPDARIDTIEQMAQVYIVTDTVQCRTYVVELSAWKRNTIIDIK